MIARFALVASCLFLLSFGDTVYVESVSPAKKMRPEFGTLPPDCGDLYDKDKHDAWADCMGVGYRGAVVSE